MVPSFTPPLEKFYYRPPTKLLESNVSSGVDLFTWGGDAGGVTLCDHYL